jgi:internalin A
MLRELVLLTIAALFGLGSVMSALAAPTHFPSTPAWVWHWLFWGGLALMLVMVLDVACLLFWRPRPLAALLANAGLLFLSAAVISQFSPTYSSDVDLSAATSAAVARLAELGWTVKPGDNDILFEVANRALPPMKESATHFARLKKPFTLHFQSIKSLDGLHYLADIKGCSKIEVNAGEFTDISELHGFSHLTALIISQVPLNGDGIVDASALASLSNLELLGLNSTRVRFADFLAPLKKLKTLNLGQTLIADLSSISGIKTLVSLEIRDTRIADLTPLVDDQSLAELTISSEQVPGLVNLTHLNNLKRLVLIDQRPTDLAPISSLSHLESIFIWGLPQFDLAPLRPLSKLQNLQLSGIGFGRGLSGVSDLEAIGDLKELKTLTLGQLQVNNLSFVENIRNLVEMNLNQLPILSLSSLRNLSLLKKLSLVDVPIVDISPLLELPQLSELFLLRVPARADVLTELKRRGVRVSP